MHWWDIYVQVPENTAEAVSAYLQQLGSAGVVTYDRSVLSLPGDPCIATGPQAVGWIVLYGAFSVEETFLTRVCALQQFLDASLDETVTPRWQLYCRPLLTLDYLTQWQRFFHPLSIAERLMICPPWENPPLPPSMERLILDPGQAFGTGLHPTTHTCLVLLAQYLSSPQRGALLDLGCGSGILSLAALKLGMATAVGVDIDAQAIAVAEHNALLNSLQDRVQFRPGSLEAVIGRFAVITANIYLGPLVDMLPRIAQHLTPQGYVILSGILAHQEAALRAAMHAAGLVVQHRLAEEEWVALAGQYAAYA
jgi:ribosomal protein L11 methyltransferase